ncbi:hypothetical protein [Pedobacter cryophilus]|uniref:DUF4369 domain-containing protein n=1 Tax=Pedobacter cryophilus TaxID=2571271 RepID=A0A4U1C1W8_9SPHI|nr:hypothetical protein [Pedobacter cryophilus]TKB99085.1 hypothetical protein FA046_08225 [Pedobacter cryophilus]
MRKKLFHLFILIGLSSTAFAQSGFINYKGEGNVVTNAGETLTGTVYYALSSPRRVSIKLVDGTEKKFDYDDTKSFIVGEKQYHAIKIKTLGNPNTFAQLLNPQSSSFIKVYKNETQPTIVVGGDYTVTTTHFIGVTGEEVAYDTGDLKLTPFNKKMAEIVKACPELAKKIADKENGYKVGLISNDIFRVPVYLRIAQEYDACNK